MVTGGSHPCGMVYQTQQQQKRWVCLRVWSVCVSHCQFWFSLLRISLWLKCPDQILFKDRSMRRMIDIFSVACRFIWNWPNAYKVRVVWPIFFLMNIFIALKGTRFLFLFAFTAAGVVQCGGRNTSPRTSTIVQFIFYFWSFEISVNILRNQK